MQPPPNSSPQSGSVPQPPRKGLPVWAWVLIGCVPVFLIFFIAIVAAILFPVFAKAREKARSVSCMSNEKMMSLGLAQYAQDSDEIFPAAASWMDKTAVYVRNDSAYHCPSASQRDPNKYGYAFNSQLDKRSLATINSPNVTETIYDSTNLARDASDPVASLPTPTRHDGYNNIAYVDGHVAASQGASP